MAAGQQADAGFPFVGREEQERRLDWSAVLSLVNESYTALARGEATAFPTLREPLPGGMLGLRGGSWPARGVLGVKVSGFFLSNPQRGLDSHQAVIVLLEAGTGRTRAIVDGNYVTWLRTAMAGLAGTLALARPDARRVLVIGNGQQAEAQVLGHAHGLAERTPEFRVHAPRDDPGGTKAKEFVARLEARGVGVVSAPDLEEALRDSDVVITATPSPEPILPGVRVVPGTHVNAVGADAPGKRELDDELLARCLLVADDVDQCLRYGEGQALSPGRRESVPTIGEVIAGLAPGRTSRDEITVFDSTGLGLHDAVVAAEACGDGTGQPAG